MPVDIESLFAAGGPMSQVDPRFEERPQQTQMAVAVWSSLEEGRGLVVEAGTGIGKSLAYLLPAALWALSKGGRVLVSTHTRALQEQVFGRELPLAAKALGVLGQRLRYAMLMGAENYVCAQRLARAASAPELLPGAEAALLEKLALWARSSETAHRSAMPALAPPALWNRIARDPDLCSGPGGRLPQDCLYRKDRERAERSEILVVNHALLLSGARLPSFDALIIDEAHTFEEAASSHFGVGVSTGRFLRLAEDTRVLAKLLQRAGAEEAVRQALDSAARRCAEDSLRFLHELAQSHGRQAGETEPGGKLLEEGEAPPPQSLAELEARLGELAGALSGREEELEARGLQLKAVALRNDLRQILEGRDLETARWIQWSQSFVELRASPLSVAERLAEGLLSRGIPIVMTSATLSAGRGLKEFKASLGFEGARELVLDSPFDYESQAALLLLEGPPPSDEEDYAEALAGTCADIVSRVPGGVFILFSSWKTLRRVHSRLRKRVKDRPLWMQGATGNDALLGDFIEAGNAVLLGVDTFWQGVDVPGAALSCVVLTKLPFPNIASPVEEARRRWHESLERSYFGAHSLPRAVMKFRQGFGRLIRSTEDRGAVVVLDPRITRKGYGSAFLEALPKCRRLESLDELGGFFAEG